jgi:outer membrane receptor protein involved in Fe transport
VFAGYVQDNWRFTDSLTLNLGLRYETHTPWVEVKDRQTNFAPFSGEIESAGQSTRYNNNRALYNSYNAGLDFQPRFGFAWTPSVLGKKTVIRGA